MKSVTLTELRRNLENYLDEAQKEEIVITRYGKTVGRLLSSNNSEQASEPSLENSETVSA